MKVQQFFPLLFVALRGHPNGAAEQPAPRSIIFASTTSVENSGLLAHILPAFTRETGIAVHVLAQGTGRAFETVARNDTDLVVVHDPEAEQKFFAASAGVDRRQIAWMTSSWSGRAPTRPQRCGRGVESNHRLTGAVCLAWRQEWHRCA